MLRKIKEISPIADKIARLDKASKEIDEILKDLGEA